MQVIFKSVLFSLKMFLNKYGDNFSLVETGQAHKHDPYLRPFIYSAELIDYVYLYNPTPNPYMELSVLYCNNPKFFGNDPESNNL
jgi:hypothetical protein